ncbi:MAG: SEC-C domain-containing protein [Clostridia bacterium]|nr:SEC-C domain-containing protein [Clostridia bacterium]
MALYDLWKEKTDESRNSAQQVSDYIGAYFDKEKEAYAKILGAQEQTVEGTVKELAAKYGLEPFEVTAFIDGINTSLVTPVGNVEELEEDSTVKLEIVWENLYYNMCKAKAPWLYELPEWEGILDADCRIEIRSRYRKDMQAVSHKVGRNEPCPCGSGKKYKNCCGKNDD